MRTLSTIYFPFIAHHLQVQNVVIRHCRALDFSLVFSVPTSPENSTHARWILPTTRRSTHFPDGLREIQQSLSEPLCRANKCVGVEEGDVSEARTHAPSGTTQLHESQVRVAFTSRVGLSFSRCFALHRAACTAARTVRVDRAEVVCVWYFSAKSGMTCTSR